MNSYICPQSRMFFLHCFSMLCKKYFQVINIYLCPTISFRLLHLFYLRLRLQLKNPLPLNFRRKILLCWVELNTVLFFLIFNNFHFFDFRRRAFFSQILPFFPKKLFRIGDFSHFEFVSVMLHHEVLVG